MATKYLARALLASCALTALVGSVAAQEFDYGSFPGYTLQVKLIGGTQYEKLYTRIPEWEALTGAKVEIVSSKNHFDLDREIKQDIATGQITWCLGSNHTSFAPQYGDLYIDLTSMIPGEELAKYVPGTLASAMVDGRLVQLPRVTDVSNLYYRKDLYEDPAKMEAYKAEFGTDLAPPKTFDELKQQIIFFADPPNLYGTAFAGKDEGMSGRFMEILRANGGDLFDENWNPIFNSPEGVAALQWFKDIYDAGAVPAGTVNYTWDDIGQAMAAGQLAVDLDWPGFAGFYSDPAASKISDVLGFAVSPVGSAGVRGGWSGSHSFSVTEACDNKEAAVSLAVFLTNDESAMMEAQAGNLPTRSATFGEVVQYFNENGKTALAEMFPIWEASLADARTPPLIPQWIEVSNVLWPQLQAAIVGEKTPQEALDQAADDARVILEDAGIL
ncbi:MAG: sugar ABC transporter substrate-binding protein [Alphaproteobacteria bacterium]|nr:sugar ABC transporter substrate-binding protein [Alphaproteobacteria bacterium]MBU1562982.1 sugar ABC transporter substrate-binding protein [Alphaproteobacteria bacterium]MBU2304177.1 sugar ABC transporter substrate-binding protein [Alphaproteobacteria bacterium]MBU2367452.1 sugar ABC transporter substrate-binding protein [Alphaproteobacteria bacterium]